MSFLMPMLSSWHQDVVLGECAEIAWLLQVQVHVINPQALSNNELYGSFDEGTHEWQDGVLARIMRTVCKDESPDQKWILFDGPVDTLWIESMNTLLDDNKLLTLLSGERISMSPQVWTQCCCFCFRCWTCLSSAHALMWLLQGLALILSRAENLSRSVPLATRKVLIKIGMGCPGQLT